MKSSSQPHPLRRLARLLWRPLFGWYCDRGTRRALEDRARIILQSPDLDRLPRVPDAGRTRGSVQIMHNGLRVRRGSYYGAGSVSLLRRTRGIHEPQEELAFAAVLPFLPPGAVMLELGSYWAFYSLWFASQVSGARCHLVEPAQQNMAAGLDNFSLNQLTPASATIALISDLPGRAEDGTRIVSVDSLVDELGLDRIHLLHADIQGYEFGMLEGAARLLDREGVDFLFISTHGESLHARCREMLLRRSLVLLLDVSPDQSYSTDGVLVFRRADARGPDKIQASMRPLPPETPSASAA